MPKLTARHPKSSADNGATKFKYPHYLAAVRHLVAQHHKIKEEPLHLAVYYAPKRHPGDVFLLEVIGGFGGEHIDPEKKLFEFSYGSTSGFPLPNSRNLRLVLTNPPEFREAVHANWRALVELREAKRRKATQ